MNETLITQLVAVTATLSPVVADVRGHLRGTGPVPTLHGRLHGPHSRHAATVEIAYSLRCGSPIVDSDGWRVHFSVSVPEPNLWDWQSPFLYRLEIGRPDTLASCEIGLRQRRVGRAGLLWNGQPLAITPTNTLIASPDTPAVWAEADADGRLVLGRLPANPDIWLETANRFETHASTLGWLLPPSPDPAPWQAVELRGAGHIVMVGEPFSPTFGIFSSPPPCQTDSAPG